MHKGILNPLRLPFRHSALVVFFDVLRLTRHPKRHLLLHWLDSLRNQGAGKWRARAVLARPSLAPISQFRDGEVR